MSVTVDPSLTFTISGVASGQGVNGATTTVATTTDANTIPLGTVSPSTNAIAAHDLNVATNASGGYTVYTRYTAELTFDGNVIDDHTGVNSAPTTFLAAGNEAFGYTTNDATLQSAAVDRFTSSGGNKWAEFTTTNSEVAYSANATSTTETTRVGYQVGISGSTPAGNYTTTVIFTATPTY